MPNLFVDTITGLPSAANDTAKRFIAGGIFGKGNIFSSETAPKTYKSALEEGIASRRQNLIDQFSPENAAENAMNFSPMGMGSVVKKTIKPAKNLTTQFLEYLKGKQFVSKSEVEQFAKRPELKRGEADMLASKTKEFAAPRMPAQEFADSIHRDLLELKPVKVKELQYNQTTIDQGNLRNGGNKFKPSNLGKNYEEVVFESPITTNGSSHYPNSKNYFAHARGDEVVESGKKIWREQEIQSDLMQKDRFPDAESFAKRKSEAERGLLDEVEMARDRELEKLQPFTNDRFGERIMRERIREKAGKGYEKYRLPTGETIGKIEGFRANEWFTGSFTRTARKDTQLLKPENIKVGMEVNNGSDWIITDILGEGRFKAVTKEFYNMEKTNYRLAKQSGVVKSETYEDYLKSGNAGMANVNAETFDLTGKSNPQYRRYSDWGKFLKNRYGGKEIIDPQGNSWMEIDLKKEYATNPVMAFGKSTIGTILGGAGAAIVGTGLFSSSKQHYEAPKKEEMPIYKIKDRPVEVKDDELKDLGAVAFGEANPDIDEIRTVMNVAINRANQGNGDVFKELSKKGKGGHEFNAYGGKQYNNFMTSNLDFVSKKKAALVNQVLEEVKNGTLVDNTDGALYFSHGDDGRMRTFKDLFANIRHSK